MKINIAHTKYEQLLKQALDVHSKQHKAIAQNVANANNPDYSRVSTDFSQLLESAKDKSEIKATLEKHITSKQIPERRNQLQGDGKGEKVDFTREMTEMAENQIKYEFIARALNRYFKGLSTSIVGRNQ
ncbi:MAG: flagellar basal body rod protein FlgB [Candidatus Hatepunaea meridiana]|nr:flagellar basal body rod protein FlgB [Candidatus Hatepunaea meridiana]